MTDVWTGKAQAGRRKANCKIEIDTGAGMKDVTAALDPHLLSVVVIDKASSFPTCHIELDDRDGRLIIPPLEGYINIGFGWSSEQFVTVFTGMTQEVESGFGRKQGGRRLWIDGKGTAKLAKGKTPLQMHWGEGVPPGETKGQPIKLSQVLQEAAQQAGYSITVSPELGNIERFYWSMQSESFHHFGQRLGKELGAHFKTGSGWATFYPKGATDLGTDIIAEWGNNLIEWRIKPYTSRPNWSGANAQFYDEKNAAWQAVKSAFGGSPMFGAVSDAITQLPQPAPNKQVGEQHNWGQQADSHLGSGTGSVVINGEPQCLAACKLTIIGARDGVDGPYFVDEAHHHYDRSGGYTVMCKLGRAH
jgi:phage protein D